MRGKILLHYSALYRWLYLILRKNKEKGRVVRDRTTREPRRAVPGSEQGRKRSDLGFGPMQGAIVNSGESFCNRWSVRKAA
ncbi:hypothetical protein KM043_016273 [Ampulex compressa]|nr:hypothetical protein KM043_016273 [Ampulex compressa]